VRRPLLLLVVVAAALVWRKHLLDEADRRYPAPPRLP
jgi:hypothetical protein